MKATTQQELIKIGFTQKKPGVWMLGDAAGEPAIGVYTSQQSEIELEPGAFMVLCGLPAIDEWYCETESDLMPAIAQALGTYLKDLLANNPR